ncbi:O-antigen ligase family protein [Paenibacillus pasadenensis]|uniref:O-antigen ligase family protein n=1 Tax=Paenibacillus pasadenensis TaxID=217090 RepID=UPI00203C2C1A
MTLKTLSRTSIVVLVALIAAAMVSFQPMLSVGAVIAALVAMAAVANPRKALILTVLYVPIEPFIVSWIPPSLSDAMRIAPELLLAAVLMGAILSKRKEGGVSGLPDVLLISVIMLAVAVSLYNSVGFVDMVMGGRLFFRFALVYFIVRLLPDTTGLYGRLLDLLTKLLYFEVGLGVLQFLSKAALGPAPWNTFGDNMVMAGSVFGVQGTLGRYDQYGMFLAIIALLALTRYFIQDGVKFLPFVAAVTGIMLSTSRQALIVLVVGAIVIFIAARGRQALQKKGRLVSLVMAVLFVAAPIFLLLTPSGDNRSFATTERNPLEQITTLFDAGTYSATKENNFRLYYITHIGEQLLKRDPLGLGLNTFGSAQTVDDNATLYYKYGITDKYFLKFVADVNWISLLGQLGIIGVLLFLSFFLSIAFQSLSKSKNATEDERTILIAAVALISCFVVAGFLGPNFEIRSNSFYLWLVAGLAAKVTIDMRRKKV